MTAGSSDDDSDFEIVGSPSTSLGNDQHGLTKSKKRPSDALDVDEDARTESTEEQNGEDEESRVLSGDVMVIVDPEENRRSNSSASTNSRKSKCGTRTNSRAGKTATTPSSRMKTTPTVRAKTKDFEDLDDGDTDDDDVSFSGDDQDDDEEQEKVLAPRQSKRGPESKRRKAPAGKGKKRETAKERREREKIEKGQSAEAQSQESEEDASDGEEKVSS